MSDESGLLFRKGMKIEIINTIFPAALLNLLVCHLLRMLKIN